MTKLKRLLKNRRGQGYLDVCVIVLAVVMALALAVSVFPVLSAKSQLDTYADELCREAEMAGKIGAATTARIAKLNAVTGLNLTVTWSRSGQIQLGSTFTVTLTYKTQIAIGGIASAPITLTASATGKSEVYHK